jgi:hypothetical protein
VKRNNYLLSDVLTRGDSGDIERIRDVRRQIGLTPRRRNANNISNLVSKRKKRHRSVSSSSFSSSSSTLSSSDESQRNSGLIASPENIARSLSQPARRRRQRGLHLFSSTPSEDLISDGKESYGYNDLIVTDRSSRPDPGTPRSSPKLQDETVWEHGPLLNYKIVNGKPLVLIS